MSFIKANWIRILAARAMYYALLGGIGAALVGAICIALAGAFTGAVIDIGGSPPNLDEGMMPAGFFVGATLGGIGGGVAGAIIFALLGLGSVPDSHLLPRRAICLAIWSGQIGGTLGAGFAFFLVGAMASLTMGKSFPFWVDSHLLWILIGAPAAMIVGEIAGAVWSFGFKQKPLSNP